VRQSGDHQCNASQCAYTDVVCWSLDEVNDALPYMKYYDATTNAYIQQDPRNTTTNNKQQRLPVQSMYAKLLIRNSGQVPAKVTVYRWEVVDETENGPTNVFNADIADDAQEVNIPGTGDVTVSPLVHMTDSSTLRKIWRLKSTKTKWLQNGRSMQTVASCGPKIYDVDYFLNDTTNYTKKLASTVWTIRVEGTLGHEDAAAPTKEGLLKASIDYMVDRITTIKYQCGGPGQRYSVINDTSTFDQTDTTAKTGVNPRTDNYAFNEQ